MLCVTESKALLGILGFLINVIHVISGIADGPEEIQGKEARSTVVQRDHVIFKPFFAYGAKLRNAWYQDCVKVNMVFTEYLMEMYRHDNQ